MDPSFHHSPATPNKDHARDDLEAQEVEELATTTRDLHTINRRQLEILEELRNRRENERVQTAVETTRVNAPAMGGTT